MHVFLVPRSLPLLFCWREFLVEYLNIRKKTEKDHFQVYMFVNATAEPEITAPLWSEKYFTSLSSTLSTAVHSGVCICDTGP